MSETLDDGLLFDGYIQPPDVPPDPTGNDWRGPPGPVGPPGPQGIPGPMPPGAPFLPLTGGTLTGPLIYTATGGTVPRSAQDRAADVANVLDFGADPTGVADSSAAINAAAACVAAGSTLRKAVYLPTGTYRVNHQINLTACQTLYGDSRGSSVLLIDQAFDPAATAVIYCTPSSYDAGPVLRDFGFNFVQPQDQATRANFKTLAAGGTSGPGGTGVQYPWAVAAGGESFRIQIIRVRVSGGWNGFTTNNHNALYYLDDIEMGTLNIGVSYGKGTAVLDFTQFVGFHFWNWGLGGSGIWNVYSDGQNIALLFGNGTCALIGPTIFMGRVIFSDDTGRNDMACHITNAQMDGSKSGVEIVAPMNHLNIANMYGSAGTDRVRPFINVAAGAYVNITNYYAHSTSAFQDILVNDPAAVVSVRGLTVNFLSPGVIWAEVQHGVLRVVHGWFNLQGPRTIPLIAETANGHLVVDDLTINSPNASGPLISVVTTGSFTMIGRINTQTGSAWTFSLPPGLVMTSYSPQTHFAGALFTDSSIQAGGPEHRYSREPCSDSGGGDTEGAAVLSRWQSRLGPRGQRRHGRFEHLAV